ncbi:MAG: endolytic transglycosylase MltG [Acidobacteria bacterium]|nr:MAG: endolytic transglycosylase MltG [Acidobacteriota bacterium]
MHGDIRVNNNENQTTERASNPKFRGAVMAVVVLGAGLVLFLGANTFARFVSGNDGWDVVAGQPVEVTVESGSSAAKIYRVMHDARVVRESDLRAAVDAAGVADRLQAGTYSLTTDMLPDDVVRRLVEGGDVNAGSTFTLIEGWTIDRIIDELSKTTPYSRGEYRAALRDEIVISPLLPPDVADPIIRWEGLLFPAKYPLNESDSPAQILQMMANEMTRRFEAVNWSRIGELGITRYEALIIGSLVEWEASVEEDRPMISSVIHNRLNRPMRLQIDATVIYALGYNPGRVLATHLKVDSPYNTYRVDGLPPTPIGAVSTASLTAAADPATTDYFFYVLGNTDGTHVFATTLEEHRANVRAARAAGVLP